MNRWWCLLIVLWPATAAAGSLCGTVRDASTQLAVSAAGVFLYQAGSYLGVHDVTDGAGGYCFDPLADGTYDLQVRVENYEPKWVLGIEVQSATGVDVFPTRSMHLSAWPNPAASSMRLGLRDPPGRNVVITVFDLRGRVVRRWTGERSGEIDVVWDLRNSGGGAVASGTYLLQVRSGRAVAGLKISILR